MHFADLHCHALYDADDGARSADEMRAIVDAAYADGTRILCLTPHFHPGYYGDNRADSQRSFEELEDYVKRAHPDMRLYLANELHYSPDCLSWLAQGLVRPVIGRHVLVDFSASEERGVIMGAMHKLLNAGYLPILAHPERYKNLDVRLADLQELRSAGILLQVDAQSLFGRFGFGAQIRAKAILKAHLAAFVASDAHDCAGRPPELSPAFELVCRKYGEGYAEALFLGNALRLLRLKPAGKHAR